MNIVVAGIGGVGGFFGGMLAKKYESDENIQISFLARGEHLAAIKSKGLKVLSGNGSFIAMPQKATDNVLDLDQADLIIISTKNYDLDSVLEQLKPCIHENTIILPLLNGVEASNRIRAFYPKNCVLHGCVYIVSRLKEPGIIENRGTIQTLYFGLDGLQHDRLMKLESIFKNAGIGAVYSKDIMSIVWEKFIFLSPIATATSYFDSRIGEILANEERLTFLERLIKEVISLAESKRILLDLDIFNVTIKKLNKMPVDATSSMHSDFIARRARTEIDSLTKYVIEESKKYGIETPSFQIAYKNLIS